LGVYNGADPAIWKQTLAQAWDEFAQATPNAFCITNGQFFSSTKENPTTLAFPVKIGGKLVSDGYSRQYADRHMMLEVWPAQANISPLSQFALYTSSAPNIIVGISENTGLSSRNATRRTFVGIADGDNDGASEIIFILTTPWATQTQAADILHEWGASRVMMLDGGDSTQLICRGMAYLTSRSNRLVPQTLAVKSGPSPYINPPLPPFPPAACWARYDVQRGDTLPSIASYYMVGLDTLARANRLANPYLLLPGQTVCVP
jgi:hypothetical protein